MRVLGDAVSSPACALGACYTQGHTAYLIAIYTLPHNFQNRKN